MGEEGKRRMKRLLVLWMIVGLGMIVPVLSQADPHGGGQSHSQSERGRQERPQRASDHNRQQHRNLGAGLTPQQRRELRRDVDQAGRQIYRNPGRGNGRR